MGFGFDALHVPFAQEASLTYSAARDFRGRSESPCCEKRQDASEQKSEASDNCDTVLMHFGPYLKVHGPSLIFSLPLYTYISSKTRCYLLFLECLDFCGDT